MVFGGRGWTGLDHRIDAMAMAQLQTSEYFVARERKRALGF